MDQKFKWIAGGLAWLSLAQPAFAQGQAPCVTEEEVGAMLVYAAPSLIRSVGLRCGSALSSKGFLATQGESMATRYQQRGAEVWPVAKSGIMKIVGKPDQVALLKQLPDEALRPMFGALVSQLLVNDIKPADCGKVERAFEIVAPLPVESVGELTGFVAAVAASSPAEKGARSKMPICPYSVSAPAGMGATK